MFWGDDLDRILHLLAENERLRNIILSPLDADVHPWQWVAALLSEYNELRQKSGVQPVDFDADATMTGKVGALLTACEKYMNNLGMNAVQGLRSMGGKAGLKTLNLYAR